MNQSKQQIANPKDVVGRMKPPLHLIPPVASIHESMAMKDGADKYGSYNWRSKTVAASVYIGACLRHLFAYQDGEINAADSHVHHLGHARACLGIILDAESNGTLVDDRPLPGKASELITKLTADNTRPKSIAVEEIMTGRGEFVNKPLLPFKGVPVEFREKFSDEKQQTLISQTFYIAGPMRGYPRFNFPAFDEARSRGLALKYNIISPADMDRESDFHETNPAEAAAGPEMARTFCKRDTEALLSLRAENGDGIALLPGWEKSVGALAEFFIARWLGLKVVDARTFEPFLYSTLRDNTLSPILAGAIRYLEGR